MSEIVQGADAAVFGLAIVIAVIFGLCLVAAFLGNITNAVSHYLWRRRFRPSDSNRPADTVREREGEGERQ